MILANQGLSGKGQCLYLEYRYQDPSAFIIHVVYLYLSTDHNFYWTIITQWATEYLLVVSTYVPLTVNGASC